MMNVPGIVNGDPKACSKVAAAVKLGKPVDGHAPLCTGADLEAYARAGIRTDHECTTTAELRERISLGMYVSIREGSLAKNLLPLIENLTADLSRRCSFCTDDRHAADTLERGHINGMLAMAVKAGIRPVDAVRMATLNTAECYGLQDRGAIAPGRRVDLLLVDNLKDFRPLAVWTKGRLVARNGSLVIGAPKQKPGFLAATVRIAPATAESFDFKAPSEKARMIGLLPHSLITEEKIAAVKTLRDGTVRLSDNPGLVKLAIVERHRRSGRIGTCLLDPAYRLRGGAIATSVSHDSHNIVVAGDDEEDMALAVQKIEEMQGGIVMVARGEVLDALPLPVAGLISDGTPEETAAAIRRLTKLAHGHYGISQDMTLWFLALPVIPYLKLTTKGLFDVTRFDFVPNDAALEDNRGRVGDRISSRPAAFFCLPSCISGDSSVFFVFFGFPSCTLELIRYLSKIRNMSNVFITGASSGIGAALARQYAQRGDVLGLVARNPEKLQALIDTLPGDKSRYHAIPADVTKKDEIIAAAQKFEALSGGADIVIANAGVSIGCKTEFYEDLEVMEAIYRTNVFAMAYTFHGFIEPMTKRGRGKLVGIASVSGIRGLPGSEAYGASKSAVITYNESLRVGLRKTGIKVQTISPGFVRTPLTSANPYRMPFVLTPDEFAERAVKTIDSDASYRTIPWQMGLLAKAMRIAPNCLWDKIVANRKQKPRLADKQKAEAEAAQRK